MTNNSIYKLENGVLEFDTEVFIIPNHGSKLKDYSLLSDKKKEKVAEVLKASTGEDLSEDDKMVQLWFAKEEEGPAHIENLCDHGIRVAINDSDWVFFRPTFMGLLPAKMFEGKKEGDVVDITIPAVSDFDNKVTFKAVIHAELCQLKFRYKRFGSFENTLKEVTA